MHHPLVRLGMSIDWASFEEAPGATYHPAHGTPGISTRLMAALHYLKYQHDLGDEEVVAHWLENPCWQHFKRETVFPASPAGGGVEHDALAVASGRSRSRADAARVAR